MTRNPYPSDVSDDEWAFVAPYLTLMTEDAPQRDYPLREVFNGVRWLARPARNGACSPNDLPPWYTVYQQTRRWLNAGVFEALVHDLRMLVARIADRAPSPLPQSSTAGHSNPRPRVAAGRGTTGTNGAGVEGPYGGGTLGQLLALLVTPANEQDRAQVAELAEHVQDATGEASTLAFVDQGYTGEQPAADAEAHGIRPGSGQVADRQAGLRAAATPVGGRAELRLDGTLSALGARL